MDQSQAANMNFNQSEATNMNLDQSQQTSFKARTLNLYMMPHRMLSNTDRQQLPDIEHKYCINYTVQSIKGYGAQI